MSSAAAWSYSNRATVTPLMGRDDFRGGVTWGEPYEIACTWTGQSESVSVAVDGGRVEEYVARNIIWTEDKRPKKGDKIRLHAHGAAASEEQTIRDVTEYDASSIGEPDRPDYRVVV